MFCYNFYDINVLLFLHVPVWSFCAVVNYKKTDIWRHTVCLNNMYGEHGLCLFMSCIANRSHQGLAPQRPRCIFYRSDISPSDVHPGGELMRCCIRLGAIAVYLAWLAPNKSRLLRTDSCVCDISSSEGRSFVLTRCTELIFSWAHFSFLEEGICDE